MLDLSFNSITYLPKSFQSHLKIVSKHNKKFRLNLEGNPISCDCNSLQFLNWVRMTNVTIEYLKSMTCADENSMLLVLDTIKLAAKCDASYFQYYVIIGSLSTFICLVVVSSIIAYRQRWKIAWHLYISR